MSLQVGEMPDSEPGTAGFTAWCTTIEPPHPQSKYAVPSANCMEYENQEKKGISASIQFLTLIAYTVVFGS